MLIVRRAPASAHLRPVVSSFTERKGHFREMSRMRPLPARPEQILEIYLAECYRVKRTDAGFGLSPDAAVVGRPDEAAGEIPVAYVVLRQEGMASGQEIQDFVAGQVAHYKQIREVIFIDAIPKSASGKILRRLLRDGS